VSRAVEAMGRESNRAWQAKSSLFLLTGEEGPLQDQVLRSLVKEKLPTEQERCLNLEIVDGREAGIDQALQWAATVPLLAPCRVVVVKHADCLSIPDQKKLVDHLKRGLSPSLCFILLVEKIDPGSPFYELQAGGGRLIACGLRKGNELREWVQRWIKERGKQISSSALQTLLEVCGEDPNMLVGELEKIILGVGERQEIELDDILIQAGWKPADLFALVQSLAEDKIRSVVEGIDRLLEQGLEAPQIVGMIARHFRLLALIKAWQKEGKSQREIQAKLRVPSAYFHGLQHQARSLAWEVLEGIFQRLYQVDLLIKSNETMGIIALKRFLLDRGLSRFRPGNNGDSWKQKYGSARST
jgi:DNA polymerase-3 subunit delta